MAEWQVVAGRQPAGEVCLDEEAGGSYGAQYVVDARPDLFEGCTEAVGEVGGFSYTVSSDLRLYLIQTAEKGIPVAATFSMAMLTE